MEPASGRRLFRPALTLGTALAAWAAVALWADARTARSYALFVVLTLAATSFAALVRPPRRR